MDHPRSSSFNGDDASGIPDDLRCKRSDGKQWRCTAKSMPDKTVCEKHYIQAKKRAANSAMRANMKKAKRKSLGDSDTYLESKSDEFDASGSKAADYHPSGKKASKGQVQYSPETPPSRSLPGRNFSKPDEDSQRDINHDENWWSYKAGNVSAVDSSRNMSQRSFDANAGTEYSDGSAHSSEDVGGQTCHQCRTIERERIVWCLKCDRRGYCSSCISSWYGDLPLEEIQKICPACRGTCNCRVCLRGGNLIKVRIREIPVLNKLQYLHSLLSAVLPIIKQIHQEQCLEVEMEKRLRGTEIDLSRTKLNVDEQMCCNLCRIPIIDYHRHCANCSYDLCLSCCQDLREVSKYGSKIESIENQIADKYVSEQLQVSRPKLNLSVKFPKWKANMNGIIPCPPREYGGCSFSSLNLSRIFKMNWVAKLVKNVEEMVGGCRVYNARPHLENTYSDNPSLLQSARRKKSDDNFLYCPSSQDIKSEGIDSFRLHWASGEPIIVRQVLDSSSVSSWDPIVIWRGIQETSDEKMKDQNRTVMAINCFDSSEVSIDLNQFIKGYFEGRIHANGTPELLKLKDWPSPSASEEFIFYQRPESISKLPLLEYIHSKWGLLNVAAKLPHYSLQNDVGPKIFISYGTNQELGGDGSVTNLSLTMRDMVYLLVHTCEVSPKDFQTTDTEKLEQPDVEYQIKESPGNHHMCSDEGKSPDLSVSSQSLNNDGMKMVTNKDVSMADPGMESSSSIEESPVGCLLSNRNADEDSGKTNVGALWDVFRRQDVPKLTEYLRLHWTESGKPYIKEVTRPLYDGALFLDENHKRKLKEEYGVEPWSFEHHLGQAVFVPAGCPFQLKNLMLGLDFLSPESLGEAARLAQEIRCLPNDHEAKLQVLEVGKISLYAASSVIKEVQKLVLDPRVGPELGFEDPNLTAAVSENLENMSKQRQISSCA